VVAFAPLTFPSTFPDASTPLGRSGSHRNCSKQRITTMVEKEHEHVIHYEVNDEAQSTTAKEYRGPSYSPGRTRRSVAWRASLWS
jgi:hypothetical protein